MGKREGQEIVWSLPDKSCRRCKCFLEETTKVHEYCTDGGTTMGAFGAEREDHPPISFRRVFKTCWRWQHGKCPPHRVEARNIRQYREARKK